MKVQISRNMQPTTNVDMNSQMQNQYPYPQNPIKKIHMNSYIPMQNQYPYPQNPVKDFNITSNIPVQQSQYPYPQNPRTVLGPTNKRTMQTTQTIKSTETTSIFDDPSVTALYRQYAQLEVVPVTKVRHTDTFQVGQKINLNLNKIVNTAAPSVVQPQKQPVNQPQKQPVNQPQKQTAIQPLTINQPPKQMAMSDLRVKKVYPKKQPVNDENVPPIQAITIAAKDIDVYIQALEEQELQQCNNLAPKKPKVATESPKQYTVTYKDNAKKEEKDYHLVTPEDIVIDLNNLDLATLPNRTEKELMLIIVCQQMRMENLMGELRLKIDNVEQRISSLERINTVAKNRRTV